MRIIETEPSNETAVDAFPASNEAVGVVNQQLTSLRDGLCDDG